MSQQQTNDLPPFTYGPLSRGQIRLLMPTGDEDGLSWTMEVVDLDDDVEFDALSYVWGSQDQLYPIKCNYQRLHVHHNLFSALPYLAHQPLRPIWIDALCINQSDSEEKMSQISSMNRIYRKAQTVWIWLGLLSNQDLMQDAIDLLPVIACAGHHAWRRSKGQDAESFELDVDMHISRDLDPLTLESLKHLLGNQWFRRVWILQEFTLAKSATFLCGSHPIDEHLMVDALVCYWQLYDFGWNKLALETEYGTSVVIARVLVQADFSQETAFLRAELAQALLRLSNDSSHYRQCHLPQDRVLGILGILTPVQYQVLEEDMYGCMNTAELYTRFSAATVPLVLCGNDMYTSWQWLDSAFTEKKIPGLPSWVPDFHHSGRRYSSFLQRHQASGRPCVATKGRRLGELIIGGTIVDTVASVCATIPSRTERNYLLSLAAWEEELHEACTGLQHVQRRKSPLLKSYIEREEIYWKTLTHGWFNFEPAIESYEAFYVALQKLSRNHRKMMASGTKKSSNRWVQRPLERAAVAHKLLCDESTGAARFKEELEYTLDEAQLFLTTDGRLGITNTGVLPGDKVCVFNGSLSPHVLRQVPERPTETYKFIGSAYVHVLMNKEVDAMGLPVKDILLV
ncbi:heterokaryon incompatibility protein-domain-containing protein [Boeremia exigua]|uniref:heterokaryon incompatibility protein-domain-containing protein n=1 Tax=Boeremia exigua TaxID=749465 RepID=UPI001E8E2654|nr:heterokaryon incompatibility protein-domain-containing protein [Boeremia exigua]KAH6638417.1 heterokaryon incompatibility protein-domain-containing protein [Boeremia exigua]